MGTYQIQDPAQADPFFEALKGNKFSWSVAQIERATTGQLHVQFAFGLRDPYRFSAVKGMLLPGAHLEACRNTVAAVKYCQKEETRVALPRVFGKLPSGPQSKQKMLAKDALALSYEDKLQLTLHDFIQVQRVTEIASKIALPTFKGPRRSYWIWGASGIGKSRYVKDKDPYYKPLNKWWDGYNQEKLVLIDDFEITSLSHMAHNLKIWGDPWGYLSCEVKNAKVALNYEVLYITCNYTIDQCCDHCFPNDIELRKALKRRFASIDLSAYLQPDGSVDPFDNPEDYN